MLLKLALTTLPVLGVLALSVASASAQPPLFPKVTGFINKFVPDNDHYHVMYRQVQWKTKTFINHSAAHQFENQMQAQGYQANVEHHGGHYHVRYRFLDWKLYRTVFSHFQAHQLENQLESWGYEAKVVHH